MNGAALHDELNYWLSEASSWPCESRARAACSCSPCLIHSSLETAAAAAHAHDWATAHRAILRASRIDGRLDPLADAIEARAFAPCEEVTVMVGDEEVALC